MIRMGFPVAYLAGFAMVVSGAVHQGISLETSWALVLSVALRLQLILLAAPLLGMLLALLPSRKLIAEAASTPYPRAAGLVFFTLILTAPVFTLVTAFVFGTS